MRSGYSHHGVSLLGIGSPLTPPTDSSQNQGITVASSSGDTIVSASIRITTSSVRRASPMLSARAFPGVGQISTSPSTAAQLGERRARDLGGLVRRGVVDHVELAALGVGAAAASIARMQSPRARPSL